MHFEPLKTLAKPKTTKVHISYQNEKKKMIIPVAYLYQHIKIQWLYRIFAVGFRDQKTKHFLQVCIMYLSKCSVWWTIFRCFSINHNI